MNKENKKVKYKLSKRTLFFDGLLIASLVFLLSSPLVNSFDENLSFILYILSPVSYLIFCIGMFVYLIKYGENKIAEFFAGIFTFILPIVFVYRYFKEIRKIFEKERRN
jgi:hypothetical protein